MILSHLKLIQRNLILKAQCRQFSLSGCRCNEDSDDDKKAAATRKLNRLLESIIKEPLNSEQQLPNETKFVRKQKRKEEKPKTLGQKVVIAAVDVASNIEGEPDKTSAEILHTLLYKDDRLHKSVLRAAGKSNLSNLLSGMSIETEKPKSVLREITNETFNRAERVRGMMKPRVSRIPAKPITSERIDIFGAQPPNWFTAKEVTGVSLPTWEHCEEETKRLTVTVPPSNIWEQMIIWTDRGMLWKFPIDNEQGMDAENEIHFSELVFLEVHLEGWCPEKGPIRHFMELVCVGLSRNHWLTAQEKKDHIMWYKAYFSDKKEMIKELGAGEIQEAVETL